MQKKDDTTGKVILGVLALAVAAHGTLNLAKTLRSSDKPAPVAIEDFEQGKRPTGDYVAVGKHVCLYGEGIYHYMKGIQTVDYAYYPIVSQAAYDKYAAAPAGQKPPFSMLVRTTRWHTVPELKEFVKTKPIENRDGVQGLIVNDLNRLDYKEADLIKQSFPNVDLAKVAILEPGAKPQNIPMSAGEIAVGVFGLGFLILKQRKSKTATS